MDVRQTWSRHLTQNFTAQPAQTTDIQVPQREFWTGDPERLADGFTLTKAKGDQTMTGTCEVWTHQFGWELRLVIEGYGLRRSWVARSMTEMLKTLETWYAEMLATGWS